MKCLANRACVFPAVNGVRCKEHAKEDWYSFSPYYTLPFFRTIKGTSFLLSDAPMGVDVSVANPNSCWEVARKQALEGEWYAIARYARWERGSGGPQRGFSRARCQQYLASRAVARKRERIDYRPKWKDQMDACAQIADGQSFTMVINDGDAFDVARKFRAILGQNKITCRFRWSVLTKGKSITAIKLGSWFSTPTTINIRSDETPKRKFSAMPIRQPMRHHRGSHPGSKTTAGRKRAEARGGKGSRHSTKEKRWSRETIESLEYVET